MRKVVSSLVISGLCANGACFGNSLDLTKNKVDSIAAKVRKNKTVRNIKRKVRKIKRAVKNNGKVQAVLGTSVAVAGGALIHHCLKAIKNPAMEVPVPNILEAIKNPAVEVPGSDVLGNKVNLLTKTLNLVKNHPIATGLTTIGLAGTAIAATYFIKVAKTKRFVNQIQKNLQNLSDELDRILTSLEFRKEIDISRIEEIEEQHAQIESSIRAKSRKLESSARWSLFYSIVELESKIVFFRKVHEYLQELSTEKEKNWLTKISELRQFRWTNYVGEKYFETGMLKLESALKSINSENNDSQEVVNSTIDTGIYGYSKNSGTVSEPIEDSSPSSGWSTRPVEKSINSENNDSQEVVNSTIDTGIYGYSNTVSKPIEDSSPSSGWSTRPVEKSINSENNDSQKVVNSTIDTGIYGYSKNSDTVSKPIKDSSPSSGWSTRPVEKSINSENNDSQEVVNSTIDTGIYGYSKNSGTVSEPIEDSSPSSGWSTRPVEKSINSENNDSQEVVNSTIDTSIYGYSKNSNTVSKPIEDSSPSSRSVSVTDLSKLTRNELKRLNTIIRNGLSAVILKNGLWNKSDSKKLNSKKLDLNKWFNNEEIRKFMIKKGVEVGSNRYKALITDTLLSL